MANIDDLIPLVRERVSKATSSMIRQAVVRSMREFFRCSRCWTEVYRGTLKEGREIVVIDPSSGSEFVQIETLLLNERPLRILEEEPLIIKAGTPSGAYLSFDNGEASLVFSASAKKDLPYVLKVALVPSVSAKKVGSKALDLWCEYIVDGACAELLLQPNKGWSDPQAASVLMTNFNSGIRKARNAKASGYGVSETSVSNRRWV